MTNSSQPSLSEGALTLMSVDHSLTLEEARREAGVAINLLCSCLQKPTDPLRGCNCLRQVLEFLNKIEGDGFGGIAEFEIARATVRDLVKELTAAGFKTDQT